MSKRPFPENTEELRSIVDIQSLVGPSELVQLAVEARGNPAVITLAQPYKMATSVRMVAAIMPVCVFSINQYNNVFYFTEIYTHTYSPTLYKTPISQGNYSSEEVVLAIQAAIPAARPVATRYYNSDIALPCNSGPPLGVYTVLFDDITSVIAIRATSTEQQGMFVHCPSQTRTSIGLRPNITISMGASSAGTTLFVLTTPSNHNISMHALVSLSFTNGRRTVTIENYLVTNSPPISANTIVFKLLDSDVAGILASDHLLVVNIVVHSDAATISQCLGFSRSRDSALVASGRQAIPLQVISSNYVNPNQSTPSTTELVVISVQGAHFLKVGDIVSSTDASSRGIEYTVDAINTSSTFTARRAASPTNASLLATTSLSLRDADSSFDALVKASDKLDLSLHTRSIYVDLQLGSTQVGSMHSTRISGRRYIGKIQMDATENGIVFEQHPQVRSAVPLRNSTASFQTLTIRLYDSQELFIDMPNVYWSCMVELEARS